MVKCVLHLVGFLGASLGAFRLSFATLGGLWADLGSLWGALGGHWGVLGGLWGDLGGLWGNLGGLWGDSGGLWGDLGGSWGDLGGLWGDLGGLWGDWGGFLRCLWGPWVPFLRLWVALGLSLWASGLHFGASKVKKATSRNHTFSLRKTIYLVVFSGPMAPQVADFEPFSSPRGPQAADFEPFASRRGPQAADFEPCTSPNGSCGSDVSFFRAPMAPVAPRKACLEHQCFRSPSGSDFEVETSFQFSSLKPQNVMQI